MVRKNAMLTVVNPPIDPLGPQAFDLERRIQDVLQEMQLRGQATIPQLRPEERCFSFRQVCFFEFGIIRHVIFLNLDRWVFFLR